MISASELGRGELVGRHGVLSKLEDRLERTRRAASARVPVRRAGRLPAADADAVYPILLEQLGRVRRGIGDVQGAVQEFEALAAWGADRRQIGWEAKAALYRASVLSWIDPERSRAASAEGIALGERVADPLLRAHLQGYSAYWRLRELLSESIGRLARE